jgi:hypothetical protein
LQLPLGHLSNKQREGTAHPGILQGISGEVHVHVTMNLAAVIRDFSRAFHTQEWRVMNDGHVKNPLLVHADILYLDMDEI